MAENSGDEKRSFSAERRARATSVVQSEKEKEQLICRGQKIFAWTPVGSLYVNSQHSTATLIKPLSLLCPFRLRFGVPIWAVVLLVVNTGICVLPFRRWPNSSLLQLQSDFKNRTKTGVVNSNFDSNDSVMEAEDDSVLDLNLVSFRSEIHPLILDSLGDSLGSSDFCSQPTVRERLKLWILIWRSLGTSQFILNVIIQGYKTLFYELLRPFFQASEPTNVSVLSNSSFVRVQSS